LTARKRQTLWQRNRHFWNSRRKPISGCSSTCHEVVATCAIQISSVSMTSKAMASNCVPGQWLSILGCLVIDVQYLDALDRPLSPVKDEFTDSSVSGCKCQSITKPSVQNHTDSDCMDQIDAEFEHRTELAKPLDAEK